VNLDRVGSGRDVPNDFNVVIEIPMHADPIKYEVDKATGALFVDRFVSTSMHYPCNYGYIPQTLSDDGDPVDVLVITPFALMPGVVVRCRPLGLLKMTDEGGGDTKMLAVPHRQAHAALPQPGERARPARGGPFADHALLRALQGPRARQVGADRGLGRPGRCQGGDRVRREALQERAAEAQILSGWPAQQPAPIIYP
jgi:hypothetical protein